MPDTTRPDVQALRTAWETARAEFVAIANEAPEGEILHDDKRAFSKDQADRYWAANDRQLEATVLLGRARRQPAALEAA